MPEGGVLSLANVSGFSGEVPSDSEGLVRCKPVLASLFVDALHPVERSTTEMYESEDENTILQVLVCDAVVSKACQQIPLNWRNHPFCPWPGGPHARTSDDLLESGLHLTDQVVAKPGGALLVPIGRFDDLELRVRVNDELHDASEVPS